LIGSRGEGVDQAVGQDDGQLSLVADLVIADAEGEGGEQVALAVLGYSYETDRDAR
jgi:hypothetical protein